MTFIISVKRFQKARLIKFAFVYAVYEVWLGCISVTISIRTLGIRYT